MLENINYQVSVTAQGAAIEGEGPAMKLWKEFERIGHDYAVEKNRAEAGIRLWKGEVIRRKLKVCNFVLTMLTSNRYLKHRID